MTRARRGQAPGGLQEEPGLPVWPPVLLYDDGCGLCTGSAHLVQRYGHGRVVPVAAASARGQGLLAAAGRTGAAASSVVLVGAGSWLRSAAIVRTLWAMRGPWRPLGVLLWLVPWPLREAGYRLVARLRHRGTCRVPVGRP
jgi:predicted DCC family thiol-disulfide oxidoreductase YuxK